MKVTSNKGYEVDEQTARTFVKELCDAVPNKEKRYAILKDYAKKHSWDEQTLLSWVPQHKVQEDKLYAEARQIHRLPLPQRQVAIPSLASRFGVSVYKVYGVLAQISLSSGVTISRGKTKPQGVATATAPSDVRAFLREIGTTKQIAARLNCSFWKVREWSKHRRISPDWLARVSALVQKPAFNQPAKVNYAGVTDVPSLIEALGKHAVAMSLAVKRGRYNHHNWKNNKSIPKENVEQVLEFLTNLTGPVSPAIEKIVRGKTGNIARAWSDCPNKGIIRGLVVQDERATRNGMFGKPIPPQLRNTFDFLTLGGDELHDVWAYLKEGMIFKNVISIESDPKCARTARQVAKQINDEYTQKTYVSINEGHDSQLLQATSTTNKATSDYNRYRDMLAARFNVDGMCPLNESTIASLKAWLRLAINTAPHGYWKTGNPVTMDVTIQASRDGGNPWKEPLALLDPRLQAKLTSLHGVASTELYKDYKRVLGLWGLFANEVRGREVIVEPTIIRIYKEKLTNNRGSAPMLFVSFKLYKPDGNYAIRQQALVNKLVDFTLTPTNYLGYKDAVERTKLTTQTALAA